MTQKLGLGSSPGVILAKMLSDLCPNIKESIYIFSSDPKLETTHCTRNGVIISINNNEGEPEKWVKDCDTWNKILKHLGEQVCMIY